MPGFCAPALIEMVEEGFIPFWRRDGAVAYDGAAGFGEEEQKGDGEAAAEDGEEPEDGVVA